MLRVALCGLAVVAALWETPALAQVRYDYDALGRLVRVIDEQGRTAVYVYGPTGNIVQIIREDAAQSAPTVSAVIPDFIRPGQAKTIRVIGTGLAGAHVTSTNTNLGFSVAGASETELTLTVLAASVTGVGATQIDVVNSLGTATATLNVLPKATASVVPAVIALPPDSKVRAVTVRVSEVDSVPLPFTAVTLDASVAVVAPTGYSVAAGSAETQIRIKGVQPGATTLEISSPLLNEPVSVPVWVAAGSAPQSASVRVFMPGSQVQHAISASVQVRRSEFNVARGMPVGVLRHALAAGKQSASAVGVAKGATPRYVDPGSMSVGSIASLAIHGFALDAITGVSITPADGISLGAREVNAQGTEISQPISILCGAGQTVREVVVTNSTGVVQFASPGGARFALVAPATPQITSVSPASAAQGSTPTVQILGSNLHCASAVSADPPDGLSFGPISENGDGSSLSVQVTIDQAAPTGLRVLRVTTPAGTSTAEQTGGNTFSVSTP